MSPLLERVFFGSPVSGRALSRHHLLFGDYVVSLTPPGDPRMPNGICVVGEPGVYDPILIGGGILRLGDLVISPGDDWDPRPASTTDADDPSDLTHNLTGLAGCGPGLTPAGDDLLAGYVAGLVLFHGLDHAASGVVAQTAPLTNRLSGTLLAHAARGEVPEPVHQLLRDADADSLLRFGHTSGRWWLTGLVLAGYRSDLLSQIDAAMEMQRCAS